jgi:hypothetical protein
MTMANANPFQSLELAQPESVPNLKVPVEFKDKTYGYKLGPPVRPDFKHDNGHLDHEKMREPTLEDRDMYAKWQIKSLGSVVACEKHSVLGLEWSISKYFKDCGGDQPEANKAYRHFLYGDGKPRTIDYEKYIVQESSGRDGVVALAKDFIAHAEVIGKNRTKFSMTSVVMKGIGGQKEKIKGPTTTNWRRTIGAHQIWISANVIASVSKGKIVYDADLTMHIEDQYNFNYKEQDVQSQIKDAENGMLELSGLGKQYMTYATITRNLKWTEYDLESAVITGPGGPVALNAKYQ